MRIAVCIKQIPRLDSIRFHPKTKRVIREDVDSTTNPLDFLALGHALALRDAVGGEVTVLTMGPPAARAVLEDAIRRGADRGVLLTDRRFAGADTLATVRALQRALTAEGYDLVLLGRSTLDGATAQVAPQLAELLEVPQITQATGVEVSGDRLLVEREGDAGDQHVRVVLPAVVSVLRGPTPPEPDASRSGEIRELSADDLDGGARDFGTRGSPTFVKDVREITESSTSVVIDDLATAVDELRRHICRARETHLTDAPARTSDGAERTIWALTERRPDGSLHPISFETIACANSVADQLKARVIAVMLCADPGEAPAELAARGADGVLVIEHAALAEFSTDAYCAALSAAIEQRAPHAVIGPWTSEGRDYIPRVAARLELGLTGDFVALEIADPEDEDPDLLWIKPAWAGTVEAPIVAHTTPSMGTLRPGEVAAFRSNTNAIAQVDVLYPHLRAGEDGSAYMWGHGVSAGDELCDCAPVFVSIGAGSSTALVELARELARRCGGALAASADAVAEGLLPPRREVGMLRRSVSPAMFLALGPHSSEDLSAARRAGIVATVGCPHPDPEHTRVDVAVGLAPGDVVEQLLKAIPADG